MTLTDASVAPIEKSLTVQVPREFAFRIFTAEIHQWWPGDSHSVAAGDGAVPLDIVLEPGVGGRIYELLPDGRQSDWGRVSEWQPPERLRFTWHPGHPATRATEVTLQFQALGPAETRVTLCHEGWDRIEGGAALRGQYMPGWDHVFGGCYRDALQRV